MAAFFQLFDGAQVAGFCVLRGASDTRVPMLYAAISYWAIGAPAAYILGFVAGLGPVGVWGGPLRRARGRESPAAVPRADGSLRPLKRSCPETSVPPL
jgi:hypothetical protein